MAMIRRQFSREFKLEAVQLVKGSGKPQAQVAPELGIRPDMLGSWKRQAEGRASFATEDVFPATGRYRATMKNLQRLRRENEVLRQERDFLKKAAAYFTATPWRSTPAFKPIVSSSR